jgi:hypothetical protein
LKQQHALQDNARDFGLFSGFRVVMQVPQIVDDVYDYRLFMGAYARHVYASRYRP